jgi:phosphonate transport system permease protein
MKEGHNSDGSAEGEEQAAGTGHVGVAVPRWKRLVAICCVAAPLVWAVVSLDMSGANIRDAPGQFIRYVSRMFPPDLACLETVLVALLGTVRIAIVGTLMGAVPALPIALCAARGVGIPPWISAFIRIILGATRTVPSLIYAAVFVSMVGLGEFAGALALAAFSFGIVTKLVYESVEAVGPGPSDAVRSAGGNTAHVFRYAVLPQVLPNYLSATIYAWEINIRGAFVLGLVGAGGIGFELITYIRLFEMQKVGMVLLVLVALVSCADLLSVKLRRMCI